MATRILFLAAQLQPFLASGIQSLMKNYQVEIILYCQNREENKLINISPQKNLRIFTYDYEPDTFFWKTIDEFKPEIIFSAGWMFILYVSWCKALKKAGAKTICAMDTQWKGNFKQTIHTFIAPFTIKKAFTHAWVPGKRQLQYAQKLGFPESRMLHYLYAPDTNLFSKGFDKFRAIKFQQFPKKFIFVGRLETHKITNLILAYRLLNDVQRKDWELNIIGNGSLNKSDLLQGKGISYRDSVTQNELVKIAGGGGVFCLCSTKEPWGTVVQEFAAAGMPLILSQQCGASAHFLNGNGFLCDGNDVESIKHALLQFISLSDENLFSMSEKSHALGISTNSDIWSNEIMKLA